MDSRTHRLFVCVLEAYVYVACVCECIVYRVWRPKTDFNTTHFRVNPTQTSVELKSNDR